MDKIAEIFNFDHIGKKIKGLAQWSCWISIVLLWLACAVAVLASIAEGAAYIIVVVILAAVAGPAVIWISCWPLYGFGELIDKVSDVEDTDEELIPIQPLAEQDQINELEMLREKGLITEEVYEAQRAELLERINN